MREEKSEKLSIEEKSEMVRRERMSRRYRMRFKTLVSPKSVAEGLMAVMHRLDREGRVFVWSQGEYERMSPELQRHMEEDRSWEGRPVVPGEVSSSSSSSSM